MTNPAARCERYAVNLFQLRETIRKYEQEGAGMTAEQVKEFLTYIHQAMFF